MGTLSFPLILMCLLPRCSGSVSPTGPGYSCSQRSQHCTEDTCVSSSFLPGACIPMQVQDDRVTRSQSILIPHLVLPLGGLPPDSGDSVPGNRSRTARPDDDGCRSQCHTKQRAGDRCAEEANCPSLQNKLLHSELQGEGMAFDCLNRFPNLQIDIRWP